MSIDSRVLILPVVNIKRHVPWNGGFFGCPAAPYVCFSFQGGGGNYTVGGEAPGTLGLLVPLGHLLFRTPSMLGHLVHLGHLVC